MNKQKFKGLMQYNGYDGKKTADLLGITQQTLSRMINQRYGADFERNHIEILKDKWNLSNEQINETFFNQNVSQNETND